MTMNRPEKRNALSAPMLVGLADAYTYIDDNDDVMCGVLTGAGGHFCSGMDLVSMGAPRSEYVERRMAEEPNLHWKALLRDYRCSKPIVAAVEGYAVAGGTEILQGTDIRVAGDERDLRRVGGQAGPVPARRLGVPPAPPDPLLDRDGHPAHLAARCRAREAQEIGLISRVVPDGHALGDRARDRAPDRRLRPAVDQGDPARVARDRAHVRRRRDGPPGPDRVGGLRERGRQGRPARLRREAAARLPGQLNGDRPAGARTIPTPRARHGPRAGVVGRGPGAGRAW